MSEISLNASYGGNSQAVAISGTSAQSAVIGAQTVLLLANALCFFRQGVDPTALSDGTDQPLPADTLLRVDIDPGNKLAFKTSGASGTVYITPGA